MVANDDKAVDSERRRPPRDARDDRDGSSSSSRETTSNRRKAGTARSQEDARTARSGKRSRDPDLEDDEGREEPAATGPGPVSSDDDPNEALPRVNPRVDGDEDATQEEASDSTPVTRAEMTALRKMQMDTAATMARLETALLASLANHQAKKRKCDNARGECDRVNPRKARRVASPEPSLDEDEVEDEVDAQMSFYPSSAAKSAGLCAVIERLTPTFAALAMAADKACRADLNRTLSDWKTAAAGRVRDIASAEAGTFPRREGREQPVGCTKGPVGCESSGASSSDARWGGSWTASATCALVDVMAAIEQYQLQYDPTTSSWAWGRHGLRLSADGVERQEPAKQAHSESDG
ncbi:unnamed protein product [Closterium sp. NIES-64]|nr:unnamed protein product [Closterium sp. NIES-64]